MQTPLEPNPDLPVLPDARYQVAGKLGDGGMATVYRALDTQRNEWVAVKLLLPKFIGRTKIRQRFTNEAQAMQRLRHRNIIRVLDVNTSVLQPYFVMEMAEGGCVVEWLAEYGAMPPRMAVDIAIQVCKGLGAAHREGVVHRDVKPHNILVNRRGVCKITDFGIAQFDEDDASLTKTGSVMGTLGYIAPEQRASARDVDERADVYSIAATLYTMLTARTTMDLFVAEQEPEIMEGIPDNLTRILVKATRYRREDRHKSMRALAKDLYHAKADLPEDPPTTPSLIMRDVDEYDSELPLYQTAETNFSKLGGQTEDTDNSFSARSFADEIGSRTSTPSIPRKNLLRDNSAAPAATRPRAIPWRALLIPVGLLFMMALFVLSLATSGMRVIDQSLARLDALEVQSLSTLTAERDLVAEMEKLGVTRRSLDASWDDLHDAVKHRDPEAFSRSLVTLQTTLERHEPPPTSTRTGTARSAGQRIQRLSDFTERWSRERAEALSDMQSTAAELAITLGLSDPPSVP